VLLAKFANMQNKIEYLEKKVKGKGSQTREDKGKGGEAPPKYVLGKAVRCDHWDALGKCDDDDCKRQDGHGKCSMCGQKGHYLKDPNGPCLAKIRTK
jgi:hypothetical protein